MHPGFDTIRSLNKSNYGTVSRTKGMIEFNSMASRPENKNLIAQCHEKRFQMTTYFPKCFTGTKEPKKVFLNKQLGRDGKLYQDISMRDSLYSPEKHLQFLKAKCKLFF